MGNVPTWPCQDALHPRPIVGGCLLGTGTQSPKGELCFDRAILGLRWGSLHLLWRRLRVEAVEQEKLRPRENSGVCAQ